jgi:hypothetical protein
MAIPPQNPQERSEEVYRLLLAGDKSVPKISDLELITEAQTGARGSGATVEMMRRLKDSNTRLTWVNIFLSVVLVFVGVAQIWAVYHTPRQIPPSGQPATQTPPDRPDPLKLFSDDDKALHDCLVKVNPRDPLGIRGEETPLQAAGRKTCIEKYGGH